MNLKDIINNLKYIRDKGLFSVEQKQAIDEAITILTNSNSKDQLIKAAKVLADLFTIGIKIFDS